mmetsp:Transcript_2792/g.10054  ORF Transcript_2792/g.10054 Transcript_2792/m.10054 type:complete len:308 (+) Transcript_2792:263-1186(+)
MERLRQETLHLPGTCHCHLILLRQFVHTQDRNNILQVLFVLQNLLNATSRIVVLLSKNVSTKHARGGIEWIHSRVNAQLCDGSGKHRSGIQVRKRGRRSRIRQIISRHINSLHGSDRSILCGRNTFLKTSQIRGERRLVSDSRRDTPQQSRHLRVGLCKAENVVHEQKHVLALHVTEVLCDREPRQSHTRPCTWGFVHLSIHKGALGLTGFISQLNHTGLNHLMIKIVALTRPFSDPGKHRETTVRLGDVVDELHNQHSLTNTSSTKKADLASLLVGSKKVYHFDSSHQDLLLCALITELRCLTMDW